MSQFREVHAGDPAAAFEQTESKLVVLVTLGAVHEHAMVAPYGTQPVKVERATTVVEVLAPKPPHCQ